MTNNVRTFNNQQSLNSAIKSICDIMRRSNCAGALQYVPELTWILFLRILDEQEAKDAERAEAVGAELTLSLESPYRWQDWAAPPGVGARHGVPLPGWKRQELAGGTLGAFKGFVDGELIPHLKKLKERPNAIARQRVISKSSPALTALASIPSGTFWTFSTRSTRLAAKTWIPRTSSLCRRFTKACCSRWERKGTTAASSSPRAKSSAPW